MKKKTVKLALKQETIRTLRESSLDIVVAGAAGAAGAVDRILSYTDDIRDGCMDTTK